MTLTPGSRAWWAAFAEFAATRAWCYHGLGMRAMARRWQAAACDATAALCATLTLPLHTTQELP